MKQVRVWFTASFLLIAFLLILVILFARFLPNAQQKAPEIARVLEAEANLPFQVLIPAYLPKRFDRAAVEIVLDQPGPLGEPMVMLVYTDRYNNTLTLSQWVPADRPAAGGEEETPSLALVNADWTRAVVEKGAVRVVAETSTAGVLAPKQMKLMLDTLGIARGMEIYESLKQVPLEKSLPPAVEVPANAEGVQEVMLIVNSAGYSPTHFSVRKNVPVRLIFTQYGEVGCGNELLFQAGNGERFDLLLDTPSDREVVEFTPKETGVFQFNCPHLFYIGAMSVTE